MSQNRKWKPLLWITAGFLAAYFLPAGNPRFDGAVMEALHLVRWYAREHVLLCLVPAFFIAGGISMFISQGSVMKYLGAKAKKWTAYTVASVSGTVLAVCSCTVLPLFSGIYRMGAGLGPASAFLYSGPAVNILAIILTARVLGIRLGIARATGAVLFSVIIGLLMEFIFRNEKREKIHTPAAMPDTGAERSGWQNLIFFISLAGILIFANWGSPDAATGFWASVYHAKWGITSGFAALLGISLVLWFHLAWWKIALTAAAVIIALPAAPGNPVIPFAVGALMISIFTATDKSETSDWFSASRDFAVQILPLLLFGVLIAGLLLGRPGHEGLIPSGWIARAVGGNSFRANFFASFAGAFMYFATLTEVPILQGLTGAGMGEGPALALLLAGPALSLPNMLVIRSVLGTKKTSVFVALVVVMATFSGMLYGYIIQI